MKKLYGADLAIKQTIWDSLPELRDISVDLVILLRKNISPNILELDNEELSTKVAEIIQDAAYKEINIPWQTLFSISQQLITAYKFGT